MYRSEKLKLYGKCLFSTIAIIIENEKFGNNLDEDFIDMYRNNKKVTNCTMCTSTALASYIISTNITTVINSTYVEKYKLLQNQELLVDNKPST